MIRSKGTIVSVLLSLVVSLVTLSPANAGDAKGNDLPAGGTAYEKHVGIFSPQRLLDSQEPLLGSGRFVTKRIFGVLDNADNFLGKALHTKTYAEDNNDSFVTLEKEGAKLGYDF
ncbi:MAG: hypothetical protein HY587_01930 [Candidatus Omnitrophica bacterium]|nr:hypothetical protein [Candidatus Omnitrophota bacterium]